MENFGSGLREKSHLRFWCYLGFSLGPHVWSFVLRLCLFHFVGFDNECQLNEDQNCEVAYRSELSEVPFLWVRAHSWAKDENEFGQRIRKRKSDLGLDTPHAHSDHQLGVRYFTLDWAVIEKLEFGLSLEVLPFIIGQGLN